MSTTTLVDIVDDDWSYNIVAAPTGSSDRGSSLPADHSLDVPADSSISCSTGDGVLQAEPVVQDSGDIEEEVITTAADLTDDDSSPLPPEEDFGRGKRQQIPSVKLRDYVTYNTSVKSSTSSTHHAPSVSASQSSSSVQGNSLYPLTKYVSDSNFTPQQQAFLAAITAAVEPKHFKEAVGIDVWDDSMIDEVVALEKQHTWDICDLPPDKVALGSQWVYKIKYNTDGTIRRHKSRVVVMGNKQVEGEDYNETFDPVIKMTTVRMFLRLVA